MVKDDRGIPVYANYYDLTPKNKYLKIVGHGIHHTSIEIYKQEFYFVGADSSLTGVDVGPAKVCPLQNCVFSKSVLLGYTKLTKNEIQDLINEISKEYPANSYNLIYKNCNHFADDFARRLVGKSIAGWANRSARMAASLPCFFPRERFDVNYLSGEIGIRNKDDE